MQRQPDIRPYQGKRPTIASSAYIDTASVIIGNVVIGEDSSVWPLCVVRGDVNYIRIGARTNIQDGSILHVMKDEYPLILGDDITVGHSVTLHGCTIESRCLIGMRATLKTGGRRRRQHRRRRHAAYRAPSFRHVAWSSVRREK